MYRISRFRAFHRTAAEDGGPDGNTPYTEPDFLPFEEFLKNKMQNNTEGYTFDWLKKSGYKDLLQ